MKLRIFIFLNFYKSIEANLRKLVRIKILILLIIFGFVNCKEKITIQGNSFMNKEDQLKVINIANEHLKKKAPEAFAESEYSPLLVDEGKVWRVEYRLPKGMRLLR
ncbi:hypothetical protein [Leptospira noguchii]|uniref:hypothetical protein n=1 Tax=Leptospira noguchii TaxID=28182 RepID=UPI00055B6D5A|nr:hypothetical protein [Leptospira noguchii]